MAGSRKLRRSDPDALYARLLLLARPVLAGGGRLVVGYSGGLDSTVLLHLSSRLRHDLSFELHAFHLHHGLSADADDWLSHCTAVCAQWSIPLAFSHADLGAQAGASVEARARAARYAAYAGLQADWVALAHHRDDQTETMLYRLARGAGVRGAGGMPAMRDLPSARGRIWRPLLAEGRAALLDYASHHDLRWVEDGSNAALDYDRNYLRHAVLPAMRERFPAVDAALVRAARHFQEAAGLLDELAEQDAGAPAPGLDLTCLAQLGEARQRNLLRWFLARHQLFLDEAQFNTLLDQALCARADSNPTLRVGDVQIQRYRGRLWVFGRPPAVVSTALSDAGDLPVQWAGRLTWRTGVPGGLGGVQLARLEARPRSGGELIRVRPGGPRRPVKDLFQEAGVAPGLRGYWPLLWCDGLLLALPGIAVAAEYQADDGMWPSWHPAGLI